MRKYPTLNVLQIENALADLLGEEPSVLVDGLFFAVWDGGIPVGRNPVNLRSLQWGTVEGFVNDYVQSIRNLLQE